MPGRRFLTGRLFGPAAGARIWLALGVGWARRPLFFAPAGGRMARLPQHHGPQASGLRSPGIPPVGLRLPVPPGGAPLAAPAARRVPRPPQRRNRVGPLPSGGGLQGYPGAGVRLCRRAVCGWRPSRATTDGPTTTPSGPTCAAFCTGTGLFSASAISSSNSASRSGVSVLNSVPPRGRRAEQATPHRAAWGDANALGLTVSEYPPRGRAGDELRQVARWLAETLAQPDMLKGAAAHAS